MRGPCPRKPCSKHGKDDASCPGRLALWQRDTHYSITMFRIFKLTSPCQFFFFFDVWNKSAVCLMMPTLMLGPCMREGPQRPEVPEGLRRLAWSCEAGAWASLRVLPPQNVRIDPSSLSFNMWKEIPVPFYLSIYFFEVTNPEEVLNGGKPQVRERGPYVYR